MLNRLIQTIFVLFLCLFISTIYADTKAITNSQVKKFIQQMAKKHNFSTAYLNNIFSHVTLYTFKKSSSKKKVVPLESKPWYIYRDRFITSARVTGGISFLHQYPQTLARAEKTYGVPPSIITAIIGVESNYGETKGQNSVINTLATYAFKTHRRASFFRSELEQFLLLCHEQRLDPLTVKGSYAGAIGQPQFMPSSYRHYAVDFSHDGQADLMNNEEDVIGSIANYFHKNGWKKDEPVAVQATIKPGKFTHFPKTQFKPNYTVATLKKKFHVYPNTPLPDHTKVSFIKLQDKGHWEYWLGLHNFYVITRYNHSINYAMAVFQLSQEIEKGFQSLSIKHRLP